MSAEEQEQAMREPQAAVVLAHGGWADGSSWNKVIAGAVIGSTMNEKVASLVYITALAPDEGETVGDVYYWAAHHALAPELGPDRTGQAGSWWPRRIA